MTQLLPEDTWGPWEEPDALQVEVEECMMQEQGMGVRKQHFSAVIHTQLIYAVLLTFFSVLSSQWASGRVFVKHTLTSFVFFLVNEPILYVHLSQIPRILKCAVLA